MERKEVSECAVVAYPSKDRGEVPIAFVVLRGVPADEQGALHSALEMTFSGSRVEVFWRSFRRVGERNPL